MHTDISPIEETAVIIGEYEQLDKVGKMKTEEYYNANYIKTSFQEEDPHDPHNPFGLMIAA